MKKYFSVLVYTPLFFLSYSSIAQKFDQSFFRKNLLKKVYPLDSEANAIVLYEKGEVHINNLGSGYNQLYHVHRIIKILKTGGQALGDVKELYPNKGDGKAFTRNIEATTYNLEGGKIIETALDVATVTDKKKERNFYELEFAIPAVKEGSIIDYQYEIITPLYTNISSWEFQTEIPKLKSEFEIVAPTLYQFNAVNQDRIKFSNYSNVSEAEHKRSNAYKIVTPMAENKYAILWCRNNIPPLKEEPFTKAIENYREYLELQISGYRTDEMIVSWKQFNDDLWQDLYFGKQITKANNFLNPIVDSLTIHENDELKKAKNIFDYMRSNFECSIYNRVTADNEISEAFNNKRGTNAEINLLLTVMLRKAGIACSPVLISKTGSLSATEKYPLVSRFNYMACVATIGTEQYFLDATYKFNRFGILPAYCYNGYARIVDGNEGESVMLTGKYLKEKDFFKVNISRITDTSMNIEVAERIGVVKSVTLRNDIVKDSGFLRNYVAKRIEALPGEVKVINISADNLLNPDKDLTIRYTLKTTAPASGVTYINADLIKRFSAPLFTATHRLLPVEFGHMYEYTYALDIMLPDWLKPEEIAKPYHSNINGNSLSFDHVIAYDTVSHMLSVNADLKINELKYSATDYEKVKTFFDKMIQEQSAILVLKKGDKK